MADPDELDLLASEYVLGVLDQTERAVVRGRLDKEPELRARIAAWEQRLAPAALALPPVEPPVHVWWNIARGIRQTEEHRRKRPWRTRVWRAWALGASALAAGLALLLVLQPVRPTLRLIAILNDAQAQPTWLITLQTPTDELRARPLGAAAASDRVQQLWLLRPDGPPLSLGLLDQTGTTDRPLSDTILPQLVAGRALAVSLEPPGGSPTGLPTGPVVYNGTLVDGS